MNRNLPAALLLIATSIHAQTVALGPRRVHPNVLVGGVGVTVSPSVLNLSLLGSGVSAPQSLIITTTVANLGVSDTLALTAYFPSTSALTTTSGDVIPSSRVQGACSTCISSGHTPFTQNSSFAVGSSLALLNQSTTLTVLGGSRTDTLNIEVDLSTSPQTPAGSYTGTMVLAAQIF